MVHVTCTLPYDHDSNVQGDDVDPVYLLHTGEGLLGNDHAHKDEDECVGKVTKHTPKPAKNKHKGSRSMFMEPMESEVTHADTQMTSYYYTYIGC